MKHHEDKVSIHIIYTDLSESLAPAQSLACSRHLQISGMKRGKKEKGTDDHIVFSFCCKYIMSFIVTGDRDGSWVLPFICCLMRTSTWWKNHFLFLPILVGLSNQNRFLRNCTSTEQVPRNNPTQFSPLSLICPQEQSIPSRLIKN